MFLLFISIFISSLLSISGIHACLPWLRAVSIPPSQSTWRSSMHGTKDPDITSNHRRERWGPAGIPILRSLPGRSGRDRSDLEVPPRDGVGVQRSLSGDLA